MASLWPLADNHSLPSLPTTTLKNLGRSVRMSVAFEARFLQRRLWKCEVQTDVGQRCCPHSLLACQLLCQLAG